MDKFRNIQKVSKNNCPKNTKLQDKLKWRMKGNKESQIIFISNTYLYRILLSEEEVNQLKNNLKAKWNEINH